MEPVVSAILLSVAMCASYVSEQMTDRLWAHGVPQVAIRDKDEVRVGISKTASYNESQVGVRSSRGQAAPEGWLRTNVSDYFGDLNALGDAMGPNGAYTICVDGHCHLSKSMSFGPTVVFQFAANGVISVAEGATLIIGCDLTDVGPRRIFDVNSMDGMSHIVLTSRVREVYPEWWGAVGDGIADDTDAIRAAFTLTGLMGDYPSRIVVSGKYRITKPIFLGQFSWSGNNKSVFQWAGETRSWGGGLAAAKTNIVVEGRTDMNYGNAGIVADFSMSYPMFVILGGRNHVFRNVQLTGDRGHARASEGIFITAGTWRASLYDCVIVGCLRPLRIGNSVHWPEDPITFTDYEDPAGYPTTSGGWMVENVSLWNCTLHGKYPLSSETQQAIHTSMYNVEFGGTDLEGYGIYDAAGSLLLHECLWTGRHTTADIYGPLLRASGSIKVIGGHSESASQYLYHEAYGVAAVRKEFSSFQGRFGNKDILMTLPHQFTSIGGSIRDVQITGNDISGPYVTSHLSFLGTEINGIIGSIANANYAASAYWTLIGCDFTKNGVAAPFTPGWSHTHNLIQNCRFSGDSFTIDTNPTQFECITASHTIGIGTVAPRTALEVNGFITMDNGDLLYEVHNVSGALTNFWPYGLHIIDSSESTITGTLPDGTHKGQRVKFVCKVAGHDIDIRMSPHAMNSPQVIRLNAAKQWVELVWDGTDWVEVSGSGQTYP